MEGKILPMPHIPCLLDSLAEARCGTLRKDNGFGRIKAMFCRHLFLRSIMENNGKSRVAVSII
jgi:hypothetical protein